MNTDQELVIATLSGDKSAFGELVLRYQKEVYRLVYRIIKNSSDTSDILQETFINAYQNLSKLKDKGKFSLWLFQIAKNLCIDWLRKRHDDLIALEDEISENCLYLPPAPDEILMDQELYEQVMKAISSLPEYSRKAVEMFYLDGKSYSEIQSELGITKGTLGRWLHEARAILLKSMKEAYHSMIWLGGGLKRALRLTSGQITTPSIKCLMISMIVHVFVFLGISSTGVYWGSYDGTDDGSHRLNVSLVEVENFLLPSKMPAKLNPQSLTLKNNQEQFRNLTLANSKTLDLLSSKNLKKQPIQITPVSNKFVADVFFDQPSLDYGTKGFSRTESNSYNAVRLKQNRDRRMIGNQLSGQGGPEILDIIGQTAQKASNNITPDSGTMQYTLRNSWITYGVQLAKKGDYGKSVPESIVLDNYGHVYVTDARNAYILKFDTRGKLLDRWGGKGNLRGQFLAIGGIAVDKAGNVYAVDKDANRIQKFNPEGVLLKEWGQSGSKDGEFNNPQDIAIDGSGNVYVADTMNNRIQKFDSNGIFLTKWGKMGYGDGAEFQYPSNVAVDKQGNIYVSDSNNYFIRKFDSKGLFLKKWGDHGSGDGEFGRLGPSSIAVDDSGNVYVVDQYNNRIQKFNGNGVFITKWGEKGSHDDQFNTPTDIAIDRLGDVYVVDRDNYRIKVFRSVKSIEHVVQK